MWITLKSSLWFLPAVCVVAAILLAIGLVEFDSRAGFSLSEYWPQYFGVGADGARSLLAAIAQSVITLAGVSFSITIVALSIAANQYSPRVLRNFMRDRGNQAVLGGLVGIFIYCIVVLRTIQGGETQFVPALSVVMALGFAVLAVGLFIYFVHHVANAIQASSIISSVARETEETIRELYAKLPAGTDSGDSDDDRCEGLPADEDWHPVAADASGYLQSIEPDALVSFAQEHEVVLKMEKSVGEFVFEGAPLLWVAGEKKLEPELEQKLEGMFSIQPYRTIEQDPAFGIRQIVDIALKALSPGINDPTTAITCLHYLTSILKLLLRHQLPARFRYAGGKLCLVLRPFGFAGLQELAFTEIRQHCGAQPAVLLAMLGSLKALGSDNALTPSRRLLLARQANMVLEAAQYGLRNPSDLESIREEGKRVPFVTS